MDHELDNATKFCDTDMSTVTTHMYVWLVVWFILFNYSPMMIYWLISKDDLDHSFGTHHGSKTKTEKEQESDSMNQSNSNLEEYIPLFLICAENRQHYPFVAKIGFYLFRHDLRVLKIARGVLVCVILHFHVLWLICANFIVYPFEFEERGKLKDKSLWAVEQIVVEVEDSQVMVKVWSTLSFIFAFLGVLTFCLIIIIRYGKIKRHWFYCNRFFWFELDEKLITPYVTGRKGSYNYLSYNLLERRLLLVQPKFWKCLAEKVTPKVLWVKIFPTAAHANWELHHKPLSQMSRESWTQTTWPPLSQMSRESSTQTMSGESSTQTMSGESWTFSPNRLIYLCFIIYLIPVMLVVSFVTSVVLICPLLDLLLHIPWNTDNGETIVKEIELIYDNKNNKETQTDEKAAQSTKDKSTQTNGPENEPENEPENVEAQTPKERSNWVKDKLKEWETGLKILKTFMLILFAVTFTASYIYPTAKIYSLIVSYTITGILKNYTSLLPLLMLMTFIISKVINVCNSAAEPFVNLQFAIFNEYQTNIIPGSTNRLIILKYGDYLIKEKFIKDECKPLLCRPKIYTFIAVAKILALITAGVVVWICLSVLEYNTLGQILLTGFVGYLPQIFESIRKPWNEQKNKTLLEKKLKEGVQKEIENETKVKERVPKKFENQNDPLILL